MNEGGLGHILVSFTERSLSMRVPITSVLKQMWDVTQLKASCDVLFGWQEIVSPKLFNIKLDDPQLNEIIAKYECMN